MTLLALDPDQLLTTTRAVRLRLDLERPVPRELVEECLRVGLQAPTSSNQQDWQFVVVTDPELRAGLADLYRRAAEGYFDDPEPARSRNVRSGSHLAAHLQDVPVLVIPCIPGRTDRGQGVPEQAAAWASIIPATWSFMLAARARGLGTAWTTFHLDYEREAADLLGIPYDEYMQAALIPVAYVKGTDFAPAERKSVSEVVHWDRW
jgi:nitroreductase